MPNPDEPIDAVDPVDPALRSAFDKLFTGQGEGAFTDEERAAYDAHMASPDTQERMAATHEAAPSRKSGAAKIIDAVQLVTEDYIFDGSNAYLVVKNGTGGVRTIDVSRAEFARWAARSVRVGDRTLVTADAIKTARLAIESHAETLGTRPAPSIRVAEKDDATLIDLGDDDWRCVKVTARGWEVIPHPADGPYFLRTPLMAALPVPLTAEERGGVGVGLEGLWNYINVPAEQRFLKLVALLHKFSACGPYPIEGHQGEQGATKTCAMKADKALTDPSRPGPKEAAPTSLRSPPREERTVKAAARGAHVLAFDNVSYISEEIADLLCRVSTGADLGGFKLYTDADEDIQNAIRPVMLNGIPDVVRRADLADRALIYTLERPAKPVAERKFWAAFVQERPAILGALLDVLSAAIANADKVSLPEGVDVRMMDFALFGEAVGKALKQKPGAFTRAYAENRTEHARDIAQGDLLWEPMNALLDARAEGAGPWVGTMNQLRTALEQQVGTVAASKKGWPANGAQMGSYVRRMKPAWKSAGIVVEKSDRPRTNVGALYEVSRGEGHSEGHSPLAQTGSGMEKS